MTTPKQIAANRRNAQLSTGPKTAEGKAIAKMNAFKHGLLVSSPLLPDEDPAEYDAFRSAMVEELEPAGITEAILTDRLVSIAWRLHRLAEVETGMFAYNYHDIIVRRAQRKLRSLEVEEDIWLREKWTEETVRIITDKEAHASAKRERDWAENMRDRGTGKAAAAFLGDSGDGFARLHRYEVGLEKSFYKALKELQRLPAIRGARGPAGGATTKILVARMHRDGEAG